MNHGLQENAFQSSERAHRELNRHNVLLDHLTSLSERVDYMSKRMSSVEKSEQMLQGLGAEVGRLQAMSMEITDTVGEASLLHGERAGDIKALNEEFLGHMVDLKSFIKSATEESVKHVEFRIASIENALQSISSSITSAVERSIADSHRRMTEVLSGFMNTKRSSGLDINSERVLSSLFAEARDTLAARFEGVLKDCAASIRAEIKTSFHIRGGIPGGVKNVVPRANLVPNVHLRSLPDYDLFSAARKASEEKLLDARVPAVPNSEDRYQESLPPMSETPATPSVQLRIRVKKPIRAAKPPPPKRRPRGRPRKRRTAVEAVGEKQSCLRETSEPNNNVIEHATIPQSIEIDDSLFEDNQVAQENVPSAQHTALPMRQARKKTVRKENIASQDFSAYSDGFISSSSSSSSSSNSDCEEWSNPESDFEYSEAETLSPVTFTSRLPRKRGRPAKGSSRQDYATPSMKRTRRSL